jgi:adenylate kinase family enzyme
MKRIMVLGVSSGVGKSTFAQQLGEKLGIDVYHLDRFYWEPGWKEATMEDFRSRQEEVVGKASWIIEGNYSNTYDIRATEADTIIYLELPLRVCLFRVMKRRWEYRGDKTRPDIGEGCEEKLDWDFIKFIITTYRKRKKKMQVRFRNFQKVGQEKKVIQLKSQRDIHRFLEEL